MTKMTTAVLHDYFATADGGGRLALTLAEDLPADLVFGFRSKDHPFFQHPALPGRHIDLGCPPFPVGYRQWRLCRAFTNLRGRLREYSTLVYSGWYAPLAVFEEAGMHVYYCHTPPRYMYDQWEYYQKRGSAPSRALLNGFITYFRPRYERAVARMHRIVANSQHVQARIRRYLGREAEVVYPPCDTTQYRWLGQEDFYLSCARLDPLKRVDSVIRAFLRLPHKRLVVASGGTELHRLRRLAAGARHIHFTGWLSEDRLRDLLGRCIATLYLPRDEDFGMTAVESMAAGKPVIGVRAGGLAESLVEGETGLLLPADPSVEEIAEAVHFLTPARARAMRLACQRRARDFDRTRFLAKMRDLLSRH